MNRKNESVAKVWMQDVKVVRWWWSEVVREDVSNDNMDAAAWCAMMSKVADNWSDRPAFSAARRQVMEQVAMVRNSNRPQAV